MDSLHINDAIDSIFELLRKANKYIDETTPWVLAKDDSKKDRLESVLYNLLESIRVSAVFLQAFMPDTSQEIFRQLQIDDKSFGYQESLHYQVGIPVPIFERIDNK